MDIANLIVAIVAMCAAIVAAFFAIRSPSKDDLQRVERNTADTAEQITAVRGHISQVENHLNVQNSRANLAAAGENVSIGVIGEGWRSDSLKVFFTLADPNFTLTRIELVNGAGLYSGGFDCIPTESLTFAAAIEPNAFSAWLQSGIFQHSVDQSVVSIRAFLTLPNGRTERTFPVIARMSLRPKANVLTYYTNLNGQC
jgi:hypothetical protein